MSPEKVKRLEAIIAETLGLKPGEFSFADFISDPSKYGGTVNDAELLKIRIENDADDEVITNLFDGVNVASSTNTILNQDGPFGSADGIIGQGLPTDKKRLVVKKNAAGEVIYDEDGNPETIEIDTELGIFPATNFYDTFIQTLNQSDVMAIQNYAINKGYIDEEDLGSEINGNLGIITENFIYEVLNYGNQEYEDWYLGSPKRNKFEQLEENQSQSFTIAKDINSFFGGIDYRTNQYNKEQIVSREIFANVLEEYLDIKVASAEDEQAKFDRESAAQIRLANIPKTQVQLEEDLEDYWKSLTNDVLSDARKEELALNVIRNWSTYLDALEAQDKSLRAGEVMNKYTGVQAWKKMGFDEPQMGGYVTFEELKPEFSVENPEVLAQKELAEQAEAQSNLDAEAQLIGDTQEEYLKWLMGGK